MSTEMEMVPIVGIHIVQYIDPSGELAFVLKRDSDGGTPMSTWLGLLELAKDAILREYNGEKP